MVSLTSISEPAWNIPETQEKPRIGEGPRQHAYGQLCVSMPMGNYVQHAYVQHAYVQHAYGQLCTLLNNLKTLP